VSHRSFSLFLFHAAGGARVASRNAIATIGLIIIVLGSAPDPFVWLRFLGGDSWRSTIVISVLTTAAFYGLFLYALSVPLPHLIAL